MNIIVSIKQVPDTTEIKIDPVTNTLVRDGVPSIINPFDENAIEEALLLKEKHGAPEQRGINSVGLRMDRIREKLATSQTSGVCLWCGSKADSLTCLYGHVLVDASLLVVTEIYDNSPRRK